MRTPDALPGQAPSGGIAPHSGGCGGLPGRLEQREDLHVHAPPRFSLQRPGRGPCDGESVRHGDQPNARAGAGRGVRRRLHGRHRGGGGGAGRQSAERQGSRREGQPPRHQVETPHAGLPGADDHAGLLCGPSEHAARPGRDQDSAARRRSLLHRRVRPGPEGRAEAEYALWRHASSPRRELRGRPLLHHVRGRDRQDRNREGRLGIRRPPGPVLPRGPRQEVRDQPPSRSLLRQARSLFASVRVQYLAGTVSRCAPAASGELRGRPGGDPAYIAGRPAHQHPHRPVPAAELSARPKRGHLPAQGSEARPGEGAGGEASDRPEGRHLHAAPRPSVPVRAGSGTGPREARPQGGGENNLDCRPDRAGRAVGPRVLWLGAELPGPVRLPQRVVPRPLRRNIELLGFQPATVQPAPRGRGPPEGDRARARLREARRAARPRRRADGADRLPEGGDVRLEARRPALPSSCDPRSTWPPCA